LTQGFLNPNIQTAQTSSNLKSYAITLSNQISKTFFFLKTLTNDLILDNACTTTILTAERQYSPQAYNNCSGDLSETGSILNTLPLTYINELITLNTTGITYGVVDDIISTSDPLRTTLFSKQLNRCILGLELFYNIN
jgi:hypothetical protein